MTDLVFKSEVIRERSICQVTGSVFIVEQFLDREGEPYWSWTAFVPPTRGGLLINAFSYCDSANTKKAAKMAARKKIAEHLVKHPQRIVKKNVR